MDTATAGAPDPGGGVYLITQSLTQSLTRTTAPTPLFLIRFSFPPPCARSGPKVRDRRTLADHAPILRNGEEL
jgi:hypothetical protein